ncbi:DUF3152 domain-containing protein [Streptomyces spectabilis]|uniref:DUF3152 domain-containing protein n=1 Tax=Streptomyces spectabilis TaxID=68270 RepID=A0A5P2XAG2_STRST|nr:DUF3152 domain-containing protein [Streptomyces spectabilis]MBB5104703.1 hypothetical protein [Streptomyces spectabilis]MCI3904944.1 DUF3152 domain-containing protein [Streptomyces spectabilis]QEV61977.1 DUF3152 domain-containing protein [Streptomyces spectabilis]GGV01683.1 hypothetical protein GCM10010245_05610 [Streptomyces spectabilis]
MGRHSRRDPADNTDTSSTSGIPESRTAPSGTGSGRRRRGDTPAHGTPRVTPPQGTPAHGTPRVTPPQGTPPHGVPQATPPHGTPRVRGGHPEQREPGGGWGTVGSAAPRTGSGAARPPRTPGPRREDVAAFDALGAPDGFEGVDVLAAGATPVRPPAPRDPYASVTAWETDAGDDGDGTGGGSPAPAAAGGTPAGGRLSSRTVIGAAAATVTLALAIVVAAQVTDDAKGSGSDTRAADHDAGDARDARGSASRSDNRPAPSDKPTPESYETKMGKKYPLDAKLAASGDFEVMPGFDRAPGKGQKFRYRVDVEKGMGLDGALFAQAVQKTLNDERSWAHGGARAFERISSGKPDFVITLASPVTTAKWCAKSGLETLKQNVSCDSASTERIMINAYRWAQGAKTYGDRIHPYRQMLINHEVGHRLGHGHVDCQRDGELAPVMQQQTKFLDHDGIHCKPNPWVFPKE